MGLSWTSHPGSSWFHLWELPTSVNFLKEAPALNEWVFHFRKYTIYERMKCLFALMRVHSLSHVERTSLSSNKRSLKKSHFDAISTNVVAHQYCWYVHTAANHFQSCILTVRSASTAKCTQLAFVTFNYGSSTFHETVIEPGALTLFETTGALQVTLCESSISADFHQQKFPYGT